MKTIKMDAYMNGTDDHDCIKVKEYEVDQFRKAFSDGTDEAWKKYRANVKRAVNRYNQTHLSKIDFDMITA